MHSAASRQLAESEGRRFGLDHLHEELDTALIDGIEYAIVPVPEKDLPVKLPKDVDFRPTGESPLARSKSFHKVKCPVCSSSARREADTMDTFVDSSWYYLRYCDPTSEAKPRRILQADGHRLKEGGLASNEFLDLKKVAYWCPVDLYVGGAEQAVMHLLYARFFAKVLYDLKFINFNEPFLRLRNQGLILGEDGQKMSKSRGNVVNPDDVVREYGADTLRMYEMFMGDFAEAKPWSTGSIKGVKRFLDRVWGLQTKAILRSNLEALRSGAKEGGSTSAHHDFNLERLLHKTIKKVTEDIEAFKFNTAISAMMILVNAIYDQIAPHSLSVIARTVKEPELRVAPAAEVQALTMAIPKEWYEQLILLLSTFAPHISEEIWENLGHKNSLLKEFWPVYDAALTRDEEIVLVIQVNGKVRDTIRVSASISEEEAKRAALGSVKVKKHLEGKEVKKVIFVPEKLINLVI